jgi:hypothetical protein
MTIPSLAALPNILFQLLKETEIVRFAITQHLLNATPILTLSEKFGYLSAVKFDSGQFHQVDPK